MEKKLTVEIRDEQLYTDLLEIAGLCHEAPEEVLLRAFREWIELREDLSDIEAARETLEEYDREGGVSHEEVLKELKLRRRRAARSSSPMKICIGSGWETTGSSTRCATRN